MANWARSSARAKQRGVTGTIKVRRRLPFPHFAHNDCLLSDRLALASAQSLAIRKLMTRSSYDSIVTPGPPLPASHPSPALLAKLHLEAATLCASAESLMRIPASRKKDMEVTESLLLYAHDAAALHGALARKWLGAEKGAQDASGMAIGFLGWAKRELDALRDGRVRGGGKDEGRDERRERRGHIATEAEDVAQFLRYYTRMNDTVRALVLCRINAFRDVGCSLCCFPPTCFTSCRFSQCRRRLSCRIACQPVASQLQPRRLWPLLLRSALALSSSFASMPTPSILPTRSPLLMANGVRRVQTSYRHMPVQGLTSDRRCVERVHRESNGAALSHCRVLLHLNVYLRTAVVISWVYGNSPGQYSVVLSVNHYA